MYYSTRGGTCDEVTPGSLARGGVSIWAPASQSPIFASQLRFA